MFVRFLSGGCRRQKVVLQIMACDFFTVETLFLKTVYGTPAGRMTAQSARSVRKVTGTFNGDFQHGKEQRPGILPGLCLYPFQSCAC